MPRLRLIAALCLLPVFAVAAPTDEAVVQPAKTKVYLGTMTLALTPLIRTGTRFESNYTAEFFPLAFFGEQGRFWIEATDADLAKVAKGETVTFAGEAESTDHAKHRVIGRITPKDAASGTIHVRVFVTSTAAIPFDSSYRFTGKPTSSGGPASASGGR
jgi:hypothetical protein